MRSLLFLCLLVVLGTACNRRLLQTPTLRVTADAADTQLLTPDGKRVALPARVTVSHFADSLELRFVHRRDTFRQVVYGEANGVLPRSRYYSTLYKYPRDVQLDWKKRALHLRAPLRRHLFVDIRGLTYSTIAFRDLPEGNFDDFSLFNVGLYYGHLANQSIGVVLGLSSEYCQQDFSFFRVSPLRNFVQRSVSFRYQFQLRSGSSIELGLGARYFRLERNNNGVLSRSDCEQSNYTEQANPFSRIENRRPNASMVYNQRLNDRLALFGNYTFDLGNSGPPDPDALGNISQFQFGLRWRPAEILVPRRRR